MPDELDLTSVLAKLGRAKEHFETVDREIRIWQDSGKDTFTVERGTHDTRIGLVIEFREPKPDFVRWTLVIGDCVHNLRCALDHLIYAAGKFEKRHYPTPDVEKNYFVIADSEPEFWGESKGKLRGLSCTLTAALERLQPYRRTHPLIPPPLEILRRFDNADKHRLLQMAGAGMSATSIHFIGDPARGKKIGYLVPEPIYDNHVICVVESSEPDLYLAFKSAECRFEIALWHGLRKGETDPMMAHTGYSTLMPILISEVSFIVEQIRATFL